MPSPLAHAVAGYFIYRGFRNDGGGTTSSRFGPVPKLLAATVALSLLPDADAVLGILANDIGKYHNNMANSIAFAVTTSLVLATVIRLIRRSGFRRWFGIAFASYLAHIVMDYLTLGRGIMLAWPFVSDRFQPPINLFFGLRWSEGLISSSHLITVATEAALLAGVVLVAKLMSRRRGQKT